MNVNKKLDRFRQWGKEKVGAAGDKTQASDDFKVLETEMNVRFEGMEKLHESANAYVKALSKKTESDGRDRHTPIAMLGTHMTRHANDFEDGNAFGSRLSAYGQANQDIARLQESYAQTATSTWLNGCDRSLSQMKDYQNARKKLESRRLAYDAAHAKAQKARRDDSRADEELGMQKLKYEESVEDVSRRMQDIIEAESECAANLASLLDAQLDFHERARNALLAARQSAFSRTSSPTATRRPGTAGAGSTGLAARAFTSDEDALGALPLPPFRPRSRAPSGTLAAPTTLSRTVSADAVAVGAARLGMPPTPWVDSPSSDAGSDDGTVYTGASSTSSALASRNGSAVALAAGTSPLAGGGVPLTKKAPPPPPPSRKTKPAPPPPPPFGMRKMASASVVPRV